jgi:hypothetical protein
VAQFEAFLVQAIVYFRDESAMANQRGYPDQRGLWAESDAIAEQFVPNESYKAQQRAMAQSLLAAGVDPEQIAAMLSVREDSPSAAGIRDEMPAGDSRQEDL